MNIFSYIILVLGIRNDAAFISGKPIRTAIYTIIFYLIEFIFHLHNKENRVP